MNTTFEKLDESKWLRGTPATYNIGSDCYGVMIINLNRFKSGANVGKVSNVEVKMPWGETRKFTRRANGSFIAAGKNYGSLVVGYAYDYRDPHF